MSTPTAPSPEGSTSQAAPETNQSFSFADRTILEYLRTRGHAQAAQALQDSIGDPDKGKSSESSISGEDLVKILAVFAQKPDRSGVNALRDSAAVLEELSKLGNTPSIQNLLQSIGPVGAEDLLSSDPLDKQEGFRELEAWVDGSLDMYRVCDYVCQREQCLIRTA
jgi:transcription initiation factor TFIID subunit 5